MKDNGTILGILTSVVGDYLSIRIDDFRKNIVTGLSVGFSRVLALLVIIFLLLIVLSVFAFGFIVLLGDEIGSMSGAAFIVGGVYLIAALVLILLRKRLFRNMFTNLFSGIIEKESPAIGWKTLLLMIVRNLRESLDV
jgi:hypothetical protein